MDHLISREEIARAKRVDLCDVATSLGYTVIRVGCYHTLKEMDSVRIYNRRSWYRWSDGTGGSQIDFLLTFTGMDFTDAVGYLNDRSYEVLPPRITERKNAPEFFLPEPASDNVRVKTYLTVNRALSEKTVDKFIGNGLIYQDKLHGNAVFVGKDKNGKEKNAMTRGTKEYNGKSYKGDARGSDKSYGFSILSDESDTVRVFEAPIDLMSFYDATSLESDHLLALLGTWDKPLEKFLSDHKEVHRIILCLDNDEPGISAAKGIEKKFLEKGYDVKNLGSPKGYKDYNEWLVASRPKVTKQKIPAEVVPTR